ncbi:MAG: hypothetical protein ACRC2R_24190 [Xenococcaceae cyanobacterium]
MSVSHKKVADYEKDKKPILTTDLDEFYEIVVCNIEHTDRLELFAEQNNFLDRIVEFASSLGYFFNASEVEKSMSEYENYYCLPIGCWRQL